MNKSTKIRSNTVKKLTRANTKKIAPKESTAGGVRDEIFYPARLASMSPSVVPLSPSAGCCSCYVADGHQNPELLLLGNLLLRELACFLGASISSLSRIALILALSRVLPPERKPSFSSKLFPPPAPNDATPEVVACCQGSILLPAYQPRSPPFPS